MVLIAHVHSFILMCHHRYHYYGLAIRETSIYYRSIYSKQGLTRYAAMEIAGIRATTTQKSYKVIGPSSSLCLRGFYAVPM